MAFSLLVLFLVGYVLMILIWEDFTYYDNHMFTLHTLVGQNLNPPIWPGNGRLFPLGYLEFNVIRRFTNSASGYYVLPILQLVSFSWLLLEIDDGLNLKIRACLLTVALSMPSRTPNWMHPLMKFAHAASPHSVHGEIPDRWLNASVTVWR